jgi:hypothetical protein
MHIEPEMSTVRVSGGAQDARLSATKYLKATSRPVVTLVISTEG